MKRIGQVAGSLTGGMLDLLYPRRCAGCGVAPGQTARYVCWDCLAGIPFVGDPMCALCGDPVEGAVAHDYTCSWCRRTQPAFMVARSAARYRGVVQDLLQALKYQQATHLAHDLGMLLAGCVQTYLSGQVWDAITYVPLHPRKARERSYNQSRLLAESLGRRMQLPVERHALQRIRWTETQTHLSAEARKANVAGAFATPMPEWIEGRRWLLVDDVMTTGATVDACARVLMKHGAVQVAVVTVARG